MTQPDVPQPAPQPGQPQQPDFSQPQQGYPAQPQQAYPQQGGYQQPQQGYPQPGYPPQQGQPQYYAQPKAPSFNFAEFKKDLPNKTISVNSGWILAGGGTLLVIATFLAWNTYSGGGWGPSWSINGLERTFLTLIFGAIAGVVGVLIALRKAALWAGAVGAGAAAFYLFLAIENATRSSGASIGIGAIIALIGSPAYIAYFIYAYTKEKQPFVPAPPAVNGPPVPAAAPAAPQQGVDPAAYYAPHGGAPAQPAPPSIPPAPVAPAPPAASAPSAPSAPEVPAAQQSLAPASPPAASASEPPASAPPAPGNPTP